MLSIGPDGIDEAPPALIYYTVASYTSSSTTTYTFSFSTPASMYTTHGLITWGGNSYVVPLKTDFDPEITALTGP